MLRKLVISSLAGGAFVLGIASGAAALGVASFDEAKKMSAEKGLPILVDFYAEWCGPCKAFARTIEQDAGLQAFLHDKVVFYKLDAEKGEGIDLARMHGVNSYPTFLLANKTGDELDRWVGFGSGPTWLETASGAIVDPVTVRARVRRFSQNPSELDARKIADVRSAAGYPGEAVAYYKRAAALNPGSEVNYAMRVFTAMAYGGGLYTSEETGQQADQALATPRTTPGEKVMIAFHMRRLSSKSPTKDAYLNYLQAALDATEGTTDADLASDRAELLVDRALYVEKDAKKALDAKLATMAPDWEKSATALNSVAWWCFENRIALDRAEKWARRGVSLAAAGTEKANILDTLAEICAATGDCGDSVEYAKQAIAEDPDNEYLKTQLARFQKLLAEQKG